MARPKRAAGTTTAKKKRNPWLRALGWLGVTVLGLGVLGTIGVAIAYAQIELPDANRDFKTNTTFV